jgi:hypothetical protein
VSDVEADIQLRPSHEAFKELGAVRSPQESQGWEAILALQRKVREQESSKKR